MLDSLLDHLDARRGELTDYHDHQRLFLRAVLNGERVAAYDSAHVALWLGRAEEARATA